MDRLATPVVELRWLVGGALLALLLTVPRTVVAEVLFDGSLGAPGSLSGAMTIDAASGQLRGENLFHSFERFSILAGESANFTGPATVRNVFSRVTGDSVSLIDGALTTTLAAADFYFLNPNGFVVGQGAQIDLPAAFHLSSAEHIDFGDALFVADAGSITLSVASPAAFGFGDSPGAVVVDGGTVRGADGAHVSLSGSVVRLDDGVVHTNGGRVDLLAMGAGATLTLADVANPGVLPGATGDVAIGPLRNFRFEGDRPLANVDVSGAQAGRVFIRGGELVNSLGFVFADTIAAGDGTGGVDVAVGGTITLTDRARITADTLSGASGAGGSINLNADRVVLADRARVATNSFSDATGGAITIVADSMSVTTRAAVATTATAGGAAGRIDIAANGLGLRRGGRLSAESTGAARGGSIEVNVNGAFTATGTVDGTRSGVAVNTLAAGDAGDIRITADTVLIEAGAAIEAFAAPGASGAPGLIDIVGREIALTSAGTVDARSFSTGDAGDVRLSAQRLSINNGAEVSAATLGAGTGGSIVIAAASMMLDGGNVSVITSGRGDAGAIRIDAGELITTGGAEIAARATSQLSGTAGQIAIDVDVLELADGAVTTATMSDDPVALPSDIVISSRARLAVRGGGVVSAETEGAAPAGAILLSGPDVSVLGGAVVATTVGTGAGGSILVDAGNLTVRQGQLSTSTTAAGAAGSIELRATERVEFGTRAIVESSSLAGASGRGGSVAVNAPALVLRDGAGVSVRTETAAPAGNIDVRSSSVALSGGARIDSNTAGAGAGGRVQLVVSGPVIVGGRSTTISSASGTGADGAFGSGGDVRIDAGEVRVERSATISSAATGDGFAGSVAIVAAGSVTVDNAAIQTSSLNSGGGNVEVMVVDRIVLRDGTITASAAGDAVGDDGGNVTVDPEFLVMRNSSIVARANRGDGGIILIVADHFLQDLTSVLDASSDLGNDGEVRVESPDDNISAAVATLTAALYDPDVLVGDPCQVAAGSDAPQSSFLVDSQHQIGPNPAAYQSLEGGFNDGAGAGQLLSMVTSDRASRTWYRAGCGRP